MDKKTLTALKASIEKWERNAVAKTPEDALIFGNSCPLCRIYASVNDDCDGCPVWERTREHQCEHTPWYETVIAKGRWERGERDAEHFHAAAREEVAFLKSLLPQEASDA